MIGQKTIKFNLNGKNFEGLSGESTLINLVNSNFIKTEFKDMKKANNFKMEIVGVVTFDSEIPDFKNKSSEPFIVMNSDISNLIVGFNIIEHLVKENTSAHFNPILKLSLNLNVSKSELETNLKEENSRVSYLIRAVKSPGKIKI